MVRRLCSILGLALIATSATAATTGFSLTHEEGLAFPPLGRFITPPGYDAAIGKVQIFSDQSAYLDNDPINNGSVACDPTSSKSLILDSATRVAEVHLAFPMIARGNMMIFDKVEIGAERNDVDGLRVGVYSGTTHRPEVSVELRADGFVYVWGQRVPTGSGDLRYNNVFQSDCGVGIDNHITVLMFHNLVGKTVLVELHTHGATAGSYRVGPFPMSAEVGNEGIAGMYLFAPPETGRYSADGMVCVGNAPTITPIGSDEENGPRTRW